MLSDILLYSKTKMNSFSQVESTLKEVLEVIKPLRDDWVTRFKIIDELREVVQSLESLRGNFFVTLK